MDVGQQHDVSCHPAFKARDKGARIPNHLCNKLRPLFDLGLTPELALEAVLRDDEVAERYEGLLLHTVQTYQKRYFAKTRNAKADIAGLEKWLKPHLEGNHPTLSAHW